MRLEKKSEREGMRKRGNEKEGETIQGLIPIMCLLTCRNQNHHKYNYGNTLAYNLIKLISHEGIFGLSINHKDNFGIKVDSPRNRNQYLVFIPEWKWGNHS